MWSVFQILATVKGVQGYLIAVMVKKNFFNPAHFQTRTLVKLLMVYLMSVLSHVQLFVTMWTIAYKAPLFVEFFRQKYWSGLPFPTPGYLSDTGIENVSLASPHSATWEALILQLQDLILAKRPRSSYLIKRPLKSSENECKSIAKILILKLEHSFLLYNK